ncbi:bifunctional glutamine synthetase adenylyltransferase/deadenyltransferase [Bordetella sp. J329]|jgi:glutamate-ammonia-ligase adenylyltransferase|uniref:bifunctional [glutamate--ammonia ligase]-adenylyl-L-tyrosine phosphorylase/[glutamate--ammonia-ligase] adenylyltransferase n=1 Tax=Kerstersia gyiorum TaxID=206506 RepID=UPI000FD8241D|nr:bifunctional [glutamate--ammonia ligase]-adenylyl-L-tyrosine phosphorylase/[glutamate--ammonia-ligase] adenylyltransferase [Kerstersia gyiorum]AZV94096.1 bifunctional glutamine synthetase adenylyltransferase/deadenyltransferase [Bordetella sp. J329]MCH4271484.1 bifunctional [glutamate--ammonia ligase]-adenylyl-L-tyrosine phosphorylase/[glutamate--ammonia-ligase] adenylyltransferase [Kerstersia gyiorum]MCI1229671.1 bifunctional [glutamate--ammonia ligase]-adenylyl-L-tyrosine phosphorylase/[glu
MSDFSPTAAALPSPPETGPDTQPSPRAALQAALAWSEYLARRLQAQPGLQDTIEALALAPVDAEVIQQQFQALAATAALATDEGLDPDAARRVLRQLRERIFCTLMVRDIGGMATLEEVTRSMTALAELAVATAYRTTMAELTRVYGTPRDPASGAPQEMIIVGMGKLGGKELNVSSDIDLIMLYGEEGETDGARRLSHHEFYGRLTQRMMPILADNDINGYVFRTDLRLRPDGDGGPLAWSLDALEHYLLRQGREWERYAWLKARALPARAFPDSQLEEQWRQMESLRVPFVYRKYFDFDAIAALRALRERISNDWNRRAHARNGVEAIHNIKLGEGGIREIEFVVQLAQLMRGGRQPTLQERNLLLALQAEQDAGVMPAEEGAQLAQAYRFLRRTEHMLQYRADEQTHLLPAAPERLAQLAHAMGMKEAEFSACLAQHRANVSRIFQDVFHLTGIGRAVAPGSDTDNQEDSPDVHEKLEALARQHFTDQADGLLQRIRAMLGGHRMRSLPSLSRERVERLLPAVLETAARTEAPHDAAVRLLDLIEQISQRSAYLALLAEYPDILTRVARIVGASPWAAQYLTQHPLLLDGLIDWNTLAEPLDVRQLAQQLRSELDACQLPDGSPDVERQMNLMRDTQRQASFQLLTQDLEGTLSVEALADQLSSLADALLEETIHRIWPMVKRNNVLPQPRFAVIAYGKLGGKELGYTSDLDLVFIYEDPDDNAAELYARLGRRMTSWLTTMTSSGRLYDVDLRLRPDGDAGLLAVSYDAFARYQRDHAWLWEHQALTRARFAAGDACLGERFEALRREILLRPRDPLLLAEEVRAMRQRISDGHPNPSMLFDIKHDRGGMVDIEFITQYLVLRHACQHPALLDNLGNIALLRIAGELGLLPQDLARQAGDAYRIMRRIQHNLRMRGDEKARLPAGQMASERAVAERLWQQVLGPRLAENNHLHH